MWLDNLNRIKKESGLTIEQLSISSGIPAGTLNKLFAGQTKDPRLSTITAVVHSMGRTLDDLSDSDSLRHKTTDFSSSEVSIINKYRCLDSRGQSAVLATIDHEYSQLGDKSKEDNSVCAKIG